jgi:hypothetical protein
MKVIIDIPPNEESLLRDAVERRDESGIERILVQIVRPAVESQLRNNPADLTLEEFERLLDELADEAEQHLGPDVRPLPAAAISRAGIYGDHP